MKSLMKRSDRIAARVLRLDRAGACVPEHGQVCSCEYSYSACVGTGAKNDYYTNWVVGCTGQCQYTSTVCKTIRVSDSRCP